MSDRDPFEHAWSWFAFDDAPHGYDAHDPYAHHDPHEARDIRNAAGHLVELVRTHIAEGLQWAARIVLGHDAFALGVFAGLASKLARAIVLAEVHEHYFAHAGHLHGLLPFMAGSSVARAAINAVDDAFGLRHASDDAHAQRELLVFELKSLLDDPTSFAALFVVSQRQAFLERHKRYVALRASHRPHEQFDAGYMLGELLAEVLLMFATVEAAAKLASKLPRLVGWSARPSCSTPTATCSAGTSAIRLSST